MNESLYRRFNIFCGQLVTEDRRSAGISALPDGS